MKKWEPWVISIVLLGVLVLFMVGFCTSLAHGSTPEPKINRPNSLGISEIYTNTNEYLFGVPIDGQILESEEDRATNVRFQPYNTPALYDESVLFCGQVTDFFQGKTGPLVVTYDRIAHRRFHSIACHDLRSVFEVKPNEY
jgi:hypothetical protein